MSLKELQREFHRLGHMAGYAAYLEEESTKILLTALALEEFGEEFMSVAQTLKDASASVKESAQTVKESIDAAIARLSDNPTAADIAEVVENLGSAGATLDEATEAAASIDPEDTSGGGIIADPENPGEVIPVE